VWWAVVVSLFHGFSFYYVLSAPPGSLDPLFWLVVLGTGVLTFVLTMLFGLLLANMIWRFAEAEFSRATKEEHAPPFTR
jgi:hypothetical protein